MTASDESRLMSICTGQTLANATQIKTLIISVYEDGGGGGHTGLLYIHKLIRWISLALMWLVNQYSANQLSDSLSGLIPQGLKAAARLHSVALEQRVSHALNTVSWNGNRVFLLSTNPNRENEPEQEMPVAFYLLSIVLMQFIFRCKH